MEDLENEVWKPITKYEGLYEVSNLGRIKSLGRYIYKRYADKTVKQWYDGFVMSAITERRWGYNVVSLCKNKCHRRVKIHRVVAMEFINNPSKCPVVNHKNGIKTDNRVENLEWCTYKENAIHSVSTGLQKYKYKSTHKTCKLTPDNVLKIKKLLSSGQYTQSEIGNMFGVSNITISDIKTGRSWNHV